MNPQDKENIEALKALNSGKNTRSAYHLRYATLRDIGYSPLQAWSKILELLERAKSSGKV